MSDEAHAVLFLSVIEKQKGIPGDDIAAVLEVQSVFLQHRDHIDTVAFKYCIYAHDGTQRMNAYDSVITMYLAQPTAKAANTASGVQVSWNKVTGATTYKVYRSLYSGGKWTGYKAYKTTTTTSWTDTSVKAGQKVRYTVYAYNGSYKSAEKTGISITR